MWKHHWDFIGFERRIRVEIMTSIRRGFAFKMDEISMSSLNGFFFVVLASNRRNLCTRFFHSVIYQHFLR